ncbi:MAG: glycine--tRNA ligase subunit beta [Sporomusaceae bacterium]|nr:glycine--tRNA ligase subunit beta [Sporomusaceae bacterium]
MSKDLLLEIGTEEIPAKFMPAALKQLGKLAGEKFAELRIDCGKIETFGTPRRLTLLIHAVSEKQADKKAENKGPSVKIAFDDQNQPTKAAQGFARGQKIDVKDLVVKDGYVYANVFEAGQEVVGLLPEIMTDLIQHMNFPKNMRWADLDMRFVRPIRWLVALFGSEIIPFSIAQVTSGRVTTGHRFLGEKNISLANADEYFAKLSENYVMVDPAARRELITKQIKELAVAQGGTAAIDEDLLEEVVFLVEYPTALCGRFEDKYLALPPEALITPMREHQRYFPVFSPEGKLLPVFITVRNGNADHIDTVCRGNERVLRARLADAEFFYEEDKKIPLDVRVQKLKTIVYQDGLGTMYDKTQRIKKLAAYVGEISIVKADAETLSRAGELLKADLATGMVCEFTELQGTMGEAYALLQGETPAVAKAIFEHYLPRFAGDSLPTTAAGKLLSIADKLDNIVATFSRGLIPTGSQDPYALRRQALGIVNILIDGKISLSLSQLVRFTADLLGLEDEKIAALEQAVLDFFSLRLKNVLQENEIRYDLIDTVLSLGVDNCYDLWLKAQALQQLVQAEEAVPLIQAIVRVNNLAKNAQNDVVTKELLSDPAEAALYSSLCAVKAEMAAAAFDYAAALQALYQLKAPIDAFFAAVMVMVDDEAVRNNRLALLRQISQLTQPFGDFAKILV